MPQRGAKNKHEADKLNIKVLLTSSNDGLFFMKQAGVSCLDTFEFMVSLYSHNYFE